MISSVQRELFSVLAELCDMSPDVRLGQLLAHLGFLGEDQTAVGYRRRAVAGGSLSPIEES